MLYKLFFLFIIISYSIFSQSIEIKGIVLDEKKQPLTDVTIVVPELDIGTFTNEKGAFALKVPNKNIVLEVSSIGFNTQKIDLKEIKSTVDIVIVLLEDRLNLKEVIVTAKKEYSKEGSSTYKIESQAIKQVQAMNLSGVLALLPGNKIIPPNLTKPQLANLRSLSELVPNRVYSNSFGTAIILDGVSINTDANLQAKNPTSSTSGGKSTVAKGLDLRTISLANVSSVEVVAGVASPKYGNLSSGGIILKSKVGISPWIFNSNISSTNYQASITKGFKLPKWGVLNSDFSYSYSSGSPTELKMYYQNFNLGLRWKLPVFKKLKWDHFTSFRIVHSDDGNRHDPDEVYKTEADVKSTSYQLAFSGGFSSFLGKINYNLNGNVTSQYSYFNSYNTFGPFPIVEALESGTYHTTFTPSVFNFTKEIKGQPINLNAQLEVLQFASKGNFNFNFETGLQYSFADNKGSGRVSTGNISHPNLSIGSRSATFNKIPASKILSAYHQTRIKYRQGDFKQLISLGIRYDNMWERYNLLSPRLSVSSKYKEFNIRGAWGLAYKAPAMIHLYPDKSYIDYTNFMYYAKNPKERLAIVTTYVHQPNNKHLKPHHVDLKEVGFDWSSSFLNVQLTCFKKKLLNGITHTDELLLLPLQKYKVVKQERDKQPLVEPIAGSVMNVARDVRIVKNSYNEITDGVEFIINPKKIKATNTEFNFRYSYLETYVNNTGYKIEPSKYTVGNNPVRFGVYNQNSVKVSKSFGTLTLIQHIPSLRFVLTLATELNFKRHSSKIGASIYPYAYYDIEGNYVEIPLADRAKPEYDDLKLDENIFRPAKIPFFANFNLQVRKETKKGHSFSFFANNAPWYNPEYSENGNRRLLNDKLTVGFSFSLLIK